MDRQKSILEAAILEYIRSAKPVASRELADKHRLGISPATIRSELSALDEMGYLEQPHTSAGRIPTDRGYRFFVDHLEERQALAEREAELLRRLFGEAREREHFAREFGKAVARLSGAFSLVGFFDEELFYESGFSEIMEEPEMRIPGYAKGFARLADFLSEGIHALLEEAEIEDEGERVFIGRENPLKAARGYTMILSSWKHPEGFEGFLTMVSPRRTNYARHRAILDTIKHAQ